MIASSHLAIGAATGLLVQKSLPPSSGLIERIGIGFFAGIASHILADAPSHQEYSIQGYRLGMVLFFEIFIVFGLVFYPPPDTITVLVIFSAMSGAAFPDLFDLGYVYFAKWPLLETGGRILHVSHGKVFIGFELSIFIQIIISFLAILLVKIGSAP